MAALTEARNVALHQILEMPIDDSTFPLVGNDNLAVEQHRVESGVRQANYMLQLWLTQKIYAVPARQTELETLLDEWIAIPNDGVSVTAVADSQVNYDTDKHRGIIRSKVLIMVPFFQKHEDLRQSRHRGSSSITVLV